MAISRTNLHSSRVTTTGGVAISATTASFTPTADALLVVCVGAVNGPASNLATGLSSISGGGLTWTKRKQVGQLGVAGFNYSGTCEIWTAPVGGSPSSMTVVAAGGTSDSDPARVTFEIFSLTGVDGTTPVGATASGNPSTLASVSITLDAAPATDSLVIASRFVTPQDTTACTATQGTGWTEVYESPAGSGGYGDIETQERTGSTSTTVTWDDYVVEAISLDVSAAIAVEFKAVASTGTVTADAGAATGAGQTAGISRTFYHVEHVATGAVASGTAAITPALPTGILTDDVLLLFLETANQAITVPTPNGGTWTEVTGSPQGTGTAAGTSATRLTCFWSRYNGTQGDPTTSDSGDHQVGVIVAYRGCVTSGNPWDVTSSGVEATSDTSWSITGATTTVANCRVVIAGARMNDAAGAFFSAWTNTDLTDIQERFDDGTTQGNGGGIGIADGLKATAGAYGATTVTNATTTVKGFMTIALKAAQPSSNITVTADAAAATGAGQSANALESRIVTAAQADATGAGQAATLAVGGVVFADPGTGTGTGQAANTLASKVDAATAGAATGAGQTAGVTSGGVFPTIIAQTQDFVGWGTGPNTNTTDPITTTAGSLILHGIGLWEWFSGDPTNTARDQTDPTDSKSNSWALVGTVSRPDNWPSAGEGIWYNRAGTRGTSHTFTKIFGNGSEVTQSVVEIANAGAFSDHTIYHVATSTGANPTLSIGNVLASGPGLLLVYFYGDWYATAPTTASGWTLVHEYQAYDSAIHQAVFARTVSAAGDYAFSAVMTGPAQGATATSLLVNVSSNVSLTADAGVSTGAGQIASTLAAKLTTAAQGSGTGAGNTASTLATALVTASSGAASGAGQTASTLHSALLTADYGSATGAGQTAGQLASKLTTADAGGSTGAGQVALVLRGGYVGASQGSATGDGQSAGTLATWLLTATLGAGTGGGQVAGITLGTATGITVTALQGDASGAGQAATLLAPHIVGATSGAATGAGSTAIPAYGRLLTAGAGASSGAGQTATVRVVAIVAADPGAATGAGAQVSPLASWLVTSTAVAAVGTGQVATISLLNVVTVAADSGAATGDGAAADLRATRIATAEQGTATGEGQAAGFAGGKTVDAGAGSANGAGFTVSIPLSYVVTATAGAGFGVGQIALLTLSNVPFVSDWRVIGTVRAFASITSTVRAFATITGKVRT